jgi:nitrogen PTS system EIIA component
MNLTALLSADRVVIQRARDRVPPLDKDAVLSLLAGLLSSGVDGLLAPTAGGAGKLTKAEIEHVLQERERLQSTGIGEGVAIPHGAMSQLEGQVAALVIVPDGVDFAAIDERKVSIVFAVIGPKRATGEHLKTLARVSRLLRHQGFRDRLIASGSAGEAYDLIVSEEGEHR